MFGEHASIHIAGHVDVGYQGCKSAFFVKLMQCLCRVTRLGYRKARRFERVSGHESHQGFVVNDQHVKPLSFGMPTHERLTAGIQCGSGLPHKNLTGHATSAARKRASNLGRLWTVISDYTCPSPDAKASAASLADSANQLGIVPAAVGTTNRLPLWNIHLGTSLDLQLRRSS